MGCGVHFVDWFPCPCTAHTTFEYAARLEFSQLALNLTDLTHNSAGTPMYVTKS